MATRLQACYAAVKKCPGHIEENHPDIVLLDIHLKGKLDGIETAKEIQKRSDTPVIYITANSDEATFNRAKHTKPYAFISKPFKQLDLQRAIELTISRMAHSEDAVKEDHHPFILSDRIFLKNRDKMTKIIISDILYIEADRNYSRIFTKNKEYLLCVTLKTIEDKLPTQTFIRTHRSYIINLTHVDELAEGHVLIDQKAIPVSSGLKEQLLKRIQTL